MTTAMTTHKEGKSGLKLGLNSEIKDELKAIKLELKQAGKSEKSERSASTNAEVSPQAVSKEAQRL